MSMSPAARIQAGQPVAVLAGTDREPQVRLFFPQSARHARSGMPLTEWVKKAPRRHWDRAHNVWVVTAFGGTGYEGGQMTRDAKPKSPEALLRAAGFTLVYNTAEIDGYYGPETDTSLADVLTLDDLIAPMCRQSKAKPNIALVRPRFAGWDVTRTILGMAAIWDKESQRFEVPLTELLAHGDAKPNLVVDNSTLKAAREALLRKPSFGHATHDDETLMRDAATLGVSTGINLSEADEESVARLVDAVGDIPDWFGLDLYPYQRLGAIAAVAGRTAICDPPGLGKTRQALAVLAIRDIDRAVIVVPPVVLTNWARETEQSALAFLPAPPARKTASKKSVTAFRRKPKETLPLTASKREGTLMMSVAPSGRIAPPTTTYDSQPDEGHPTGEHDLNQSEIGQPSNNSSIDSSPRHIVVFRAGRKEPELPDRGVVIIPDSLLASRPQLRERLGAWNPDAMIYDEAHRARTWKSARAQSMRDLAARMRPDAIRLVLTGTPLFANPAELASLLAITGHLDTVFGGYSAFVSRYCKRNHFNALVADPQHLDELRQILYSQVWVRRRKAEVLKDLPPKSRYAKYVDVDLSGFRQAHDEVIEKIMGWIDQFLEDTEANPTGEYPDDATIRVYSRTQIGLMSPLRKAAGLAKVPVALDIISGWIADEVTFSPDGSFACERPLLMWAHHHEVIDAMVNEASSHLREGNRQLVGVIAGSTSPDKRGYYVDEFQAGRLPVLICSISAAGVGITLTYGSDAVFVESSFSVPEVEQAEDRQSRIGQTTPTSNTTLLAEGTLDGHIQSILAMKAKIIDQVTGDNSGVHVMTDEALDEKVGPSEIIERLVITAVEKHKKETAAKRAERLERTAA
jgi:hypothetical protein